jgi:hypothetical protein
MDSTSGQIRPQIYVRWKMLAIGLHLHCIVTILLLLHGDEHMSAHAQGLRKDPAAVARSGSSSTAFAQVYRDSVAWRKAMLTSTRSACSTESRSLCGSASEQAALLLATAPQSFDARSWQKGVQVIGTVKDQADCGLW